MQLPRYLERLNYRGPRTPGPGTLAALHRAHLLAVPFENLDVQLRRPLSTDLAAAYDKIVVRRRGGWCYEQNGVFGWALGQLGFEVTRLSAGVMRHERGPDADGNHLCLRVDGPGFTRPQLVDVGFGGSMLTPIALKAGVHEQSPYSLGLDELSAGEWRFWEQAGARRFSYDFRDEVADEARLADRCAWLQRDPASSFVLNLIVQRRSLEAHRVLRGRVYTEIRAARTTERLIASADELVTVLRTDFALDVPEVAAVWPAVVARHAALFPPPPPAGPFAPTSAAG